MMMVAVVTVANNGKGKKMEIGLRRRAAPHKNTRMTKNIQRNYCSICFFTITHRLEMLIVSIIEMI